MTPETFIEGFVARLRAKATDLRACGAPDAATTTEKVAHDLEDEARAYWLAELTVPEAARESGYSEERLRELARKNEIPHQKGKGPRGHLTICRRDLPRRPVAPETPISDIQSRLLEKQKKRHLRPAS